MNERRTGFILPASAVALAAGILLGRSGASVVLPLIALAAAVAGAAISRGRLRMACVMVAVAALGSGAGWAAYHPAVPQEGTYLISGVISDEAVWKDGRVPTRLTDVTLDGNPAPGNAYWSFYTDEQPAGIEPGKRVTFTGRVYIPTDAENPNGFEFREYLLAEGIVYAVYGAENLTVSQNDKFSLAGFAAELRHTLITALTQALGPEAGSYASAMLLGSKSMIPETELDAFADTGAAHILAVSGFHVGVLAAIVRVLLARQSRKMRTAVTAVILIAYCVLTGGNPPVIRATLLMCIASYGALRQRQINSLWTLSAAFILMLLYNPAQLTNASFQLSFAAVLGIITIEPFLRRLWMPKNRIVGYVWDVVRVSLGAQVGVLLPQMYWYHEFPLAGFALNLALIPFASVLICLFWIVLVALPLQPLCMLAATPAKWMTSAMLRAIESLQQTGVGAVWTGSANWLTLCGWCLMMLACSAAMSKTGRRRIITALAGVVLMIVSMIPLPHTGTEYIQLSVGAADAAVLHDENIVVVIDTGEDEELAHYLHAERLSVDMLLISHLHSDHAGGIRALLEQNIPVAVCCLPYGAEAAEIDSGMQELLAQLALTGTEIRTLSRGDVIDLPSGEITVLWPEEGRVRPGRDANISPLVTRIDVHGVSLLSMGDLYGTYEDYCAVPADIVKAAHHGDGKSTLEPFLETVAPSAVIISSGNNTYDVPTQQRLENIPVYATYDSGAVIVTFDDGAYTIRTHQ